MLTKSPREQAQLLTRSFKLILSHRAQWHIGGLYWYTWRDSPRFSTCDLCAWSGLFDTDFQAKLEDLYKRVDLAELQSLIGAIRSDMHLSLSGLL